MWIVKYKPHDLKDMVGNRPIVHKIEKMLEMKHFQHLIICGISGCGKSSLVDIIIRRLLPPDKQDEALFYSYTCDERSVQVIRDKLHDFVPKRVSLPENTPKIVVFKYADKLSDSVQQIMRRLMDIHNSDTLFILMCNDLSNIIENIQSRCSILQFSPVSEEEFHGFVDKIAKAEALTISGANSSLLYKLSKGDLRWTVNYLEVLSLLDTHITEENIKQVCISPYYRMIEELLIHISHKKIAENLSIIHDLYAEGLCGIDILLCLGEMVMISSFPSFTDQVKTQMIHEIGCAHARLSSSIDSPVLFYNLLFMLQKIFS